jgi:hypothetical protein
MCAALTSAGCCKPTYHKLQHPPGEERTLSLVSETRPQSDSSPAPDLQDEHALCHQWVVVQVCFWRENQQVRQQLIHVNIIAAAAAAVMQLCQHLLHSGLQQVHSSMARVLHCQLQLVLALLLLRGLQPCRRILQAHPGATTATSRCVSTQQETQSLRSRARIARYASCVCPGLTQNHRTSSGLPALLPPAGAAAGQP